MRIGRIINLGTLAHFNMKYSGLANKEMHGITRSQENWLLDPGSKRVISYLTLIKEVYINGHSYSPSPTPDTPSHFMLWKPWSNGPLGSHEYLSYPLHLPRPPVVLPNITPQVRHWKILNLQGNLFNKKLFI